MTEIQEQLFAWQDLTYRDFNKKLMPTVELDRIIGVRTPVLRKYAKELKKSGRAESFLQELPHRYFEENQLQVFLLSEEKDYERALEGVKAFLPYIDNWATCDQLRVKNFEKHTDQLVGEIDAWLSSPHVYTVRFGIEMLMNFYLGEKFRPEYLEKVSSVVSEEYYVNIMIAWYFATALALQYEATLPYLTEHRMGVWVHNKTIQKARESLRITAEQKEYLKTLKR